MTCLNNVLARRLGIARVFQGNQSTGLSIPFDWNFIRRVSSSDMGLMEAWIPTGFTSAPDSDPGHARHGM